MPPERNRKMSILGIDVGSSGIRGVVFDYNGKEQAYAQCNYSAYIGTDENMVELDPKEFFNAFVCVVKTVSKKFDDITAFAISSHGETFIPVDMNRIPLSNAIMNMDNRAINQANILVKYEKEIYAITGLPVQPSYPVTKIMWLKENMPDIYKKTDKFLSPPEFILLKLGLDVVTDYTMASRTMGFNIIKKEWDIGLLNEIGIDNKKFSLALCSGEKVGKLSKSVANMLGLKEGTIVALGGHDQPCGTLGCGAVNSGDIVDSAGTYECLSVISDNKCNNELAIYI